MNFIKDERKEESDKERDEANAELLETIDGIRQRLQDLVDQKTKDKLAKLSGKGDIDSATNDLYQP